MRVLHTVGGHRFERVGGSMLAGATLATVSAKLGKTLGGPSVQFGVDEYDPIHRVAGLNSAEIFANDQGAGWIVKSVGVRQWVKPL